MMDFEQLKADMILNGELYRDPDVEGDREFLFYTRNEKRDKVLENLVWRRPSEIVENPQFMVEGPSQGDFCQGILEELKCCGGAARRWNIHITPRDITRYIGQTPAGNCWFLAAAATLATRKTLLKLVVPPDQSLKQGEYAGIFRFRFWRYGEWKEVIIDDRLPVNSEDGSLFFVSNKKATNEFWAALMEKAYAKLHKSYEALSGGLPHDALVDFTGGVTEFISPLPKEDKPRDQLYKRLLRFEGMQTLMASGIFVKESGEQEEKLDTGLVAGHAYSVTKVVKVPIGEKQVQLIRLRNPWGQKEWKGAWGDESEEWNSITKEQKETFNLTKEDDGEFWMTFKDFCDNFDMLDICHMGIEDPDSKVGRKRWHMSTYHGAWVKGVSAGGTRILEDTPLPSDEEDTYWCNPQYVLSVSDPDPEDDEQMATLVVSLMQKHRRVMRSLLKSPKGLENFMGFDLLKVPVADVKDMLKGHGAMALANRVSFLHRKEPRPYREVSAVYPVPPGIYCLVVSYGVANSEGEYVLRIATENAIVSAQMEVPTQASMNLKILSNMYAHMYKKHVGEDESVDAVSLREILNGGLFKGKDTISLETCRILIGAATPPIPGKLDYAQAEIQWKLVKEHTNIFERFDEDSSGVMGLEELTTAMMSLGVDLSVRSMRCLGYRYGGKTAKVSLDDFIQCSVKTVRLIEIYQGVIMKLQCQPGSGKIGLEQWLEVMLLC